MGQDGGHGILSSDHFQILSKGHLVSVGNLRVAEPLSQCRLATFSNFKLLPYFLLDIAKVAFPQVRVILSKVLNRIVIVLFHCLKLYFPHVAVIKLCVPVKLGKERLQQRLVSAKIQSVSQLKITQGFHLD